VEEPRVVVAVVGAVRDPAVAVLPRAGPGPVVQEPADPGRAARYRVVPGRPGQPTAMAIEAVLVMALDTAPGMEAVIGPATDLAAGLRS
jgi:hypothetical protein